MHPPDPAAHGAGGGPELRLQSLQDLVADPLPHLGHPPGRSRSMHAPQLGQRVDGKAIHVVEPKCSLVLGLQAGERFPKRDPKHLGALGIEQGPLLLAPDRFGVGEFDGCGFSPSEPRGVVVALPQDAVRSTYRGDFQPSTQTPSPLVPIDRGSTALAHEHDLEGLGVRLIAQRGGQLHASERRSDRSTVEAHEELGRPMDASATGGGQEQIVGMLSRRRGAMEAQRERFE